MKLKIKILLLLYTEISTKYKFSFDNRTGNVKQDSQFQIKDLFCIQL